uniref:Secreted protein n=1 Tax=Syphacia muris TaxID=451379 RepID=A0A0N5ANZ1_9BILA
MLYGHVTLLMLRVVEVVSKTTVQQSPHMKAAIIPGEIQAKLLGSGFKQLATEVDSRSFSSEVSCFRSLYPSLDFDDVALTCIDTVYGFICIFGAKFSLI